MLKVDMAKAYNRVDWKFLNQIIGRFGFPFKVRKLILECVETPYFL